GLSCIRALLFALHEIFLSRVDARLVARSANVARSSTAIRDSRDGELRRSACGNFGLSAAAECFVVAPLPIYVEQSLFPLFLVSAVTGYWGALQTVANALRHTSRTGPQSRLAALALVALIPVGILGFAFTRPIYLTDLYNEPWPDESE